MAGIVSRVLIVGGTGHMGRRLVRASLKLGHPTYVLFRDENINDMEKVELVLDFKRAGAHLVSGSFNDRESLMRAVKAVDVVVSAVAGNHIQDAILEQLKLVDVIKEAGHIKRFIPSEYGMDPDRMLMANALPPGNQLFKDKSKVRRAIEEAGIPHTYVSGNCYAAYFLGGLGQIAMGHVPPRQHVTLYGDGNVKAVWNDEMDIAMYVIKTVDDPRTLNRAIFVRPPKNILSQREVVQIWEKLIGHELQKTQISAEDWLKTAQGKPIGVEVAIVHNIHLFYEGCLANFELSNDEEASKLYPDVEYTTVEEYLKRYV
ncbi:bifunctional pinoresinol-lariciresinol reductase 2-like protein [Cinnamomum micranthum f. kanehirae]|uniref:Bifunctional pinoresinol-lariciresinol reductase 2-like protein n=1 Tax=Cinnamomum micranthum f. kanehirae TaxID=337451 RepID=A0A3S3MLV5_9MAGN|nr:bifunctional pinoresinol-lariciresinol reductase 2-like protein [Cinnamomum micranthum f. kanehirae]